MRRALALLLAGLVAACGGGAPERPSALLITLDTTNPEALSCYDGPGASTPHLDRLAAEGLLFENARTVAPITLPAHASMLTGLTPLRHSVRRNGSMVVPPEAKTLAELARGAGLRTAAFVAAVVLNAEFGLDQGFEVYDNPATPDNVEEHLDASRPAAEVVERALAWLAGIGKDEPFFLWVHFYDPHFPYKPPPEYAAQADGDAYVGEVRAMDAAIGTLLAELEASGRRANTWIVAVADHGEALGRHGEDTHGYFAYDSTLRVPLIVSPPDAGARAGSRLAPPVSVVDVFPTLAQALGLETYGDLDGIDLLGPLDPERGVYVESYFGVVAFNWSQLAGWADARGKFVHSSAPELYDLLADPGETQNVFASQPREAQRLRAALERHTALPRLEREKLDEAYMGLAGQIERLGYAGADTTEEGTPEPLEPSTRPSPHQRIHAYADFAQARKLMVEKGDMKEAARLLQRVVAGNRENHKAQFHLAMCLKALGRFPEAIPAFRAVLQHPGGERIPAELNLAVCYYNVGQPDLAIDHLKSALEETVGPPGAMELLIELLEKHGRASEAEPYRRRLSAARPG